MVCITLETKETTSITLNSLRYRDRDLILWGLTEEFGKVTAIARNGIQSKRFGGSVNRFAASKWNLETKSVRLAEMEDERILGLQSADLKRSFDGLAKDFDRMSHASFAIELCHRGLPAMRPFPEVFKLLGNALDLYETAPLENLMELSTHFIFKFLFALGCQPVLTRCQSCHKPVHECVGDTIRFRALEGGWVCKDCSNITSASVVHTVNRHNFMEWIPTTLEPIRTSFKAGSPVPVRDLFESLISHLQFHTPGFEKKPLQTLSFILVRR